MEWLKLQSALAGIERRGSSLLGLIAVSERHGYVTGQHIETRAKQLAQELRELADTLDVPAPSLKNACLMHGLATRA